MVGFADFVTPINMRLCDTDNDVLSPLLPLSHLYTCATPHSVRII